MVVEDNFEFGPQQQYPAQSDPYNRMIYDIIRRISVLQGVKGDKPSHEWDGTRIRFQNPDGSWGAYVDIVGTTGTANNIIAQYSINGMGGWHDVYVEAEDKYFRHSYDGGTTWSYAIAFGGVDGDPGGKGNDAYPVLMQFSEDGATNWHNTPTVDDEYIRFSNDNGVSWSDAAYYKGNPGNDGNDAPAVIIQYSVNGSSWHTPYNAGVDKYIRFSVDNGSTWLVSDRFIGTDGTNGINQFLYIAWADDDQGNGFTMDFDPTKFYRAEIQSTVVIPSPNASDFAGKWKYSKGVPGEDGQNVYHYIGYASDINGSDFTLVNDPNLDFIAILLSYNYIANPVVGDFIGLWFKRKGDNGSNAYYIELPSATTVAGRCDAIISQPSGWTIDSGDNVAGNPLSSNPIDLVIQHNLGKEVIGVLVKSKTVDKQIQLVGPAAYSYFEDDDTKNYLCIKSFSETLTALGIFIMFES